jgi:NMD protein affecting ribosome stability and mRNA decay
VWYKSDPDISYPVVDYYCNKCGKYLRSDEYESSIIKIRKQVYYPSRKISISHPKEHKERER